MTFIYRSGILSPKDMQCPACLTLPESEGRNVRSVAPALQVALAGAAPADLAQPPAQTVMRDRARLPARLRDAEEERLEVVGSKSGRPDPLGDVDQFAPSYRARR